MTDKSHRVPSPDPAGASGASGEVERVDVLVVGAGISGLGAARHLAVEAPRKSFVILEARDGIGGTWDLFRYPGVRSDSDLYTFGYGFKPWRDQETIADASRILDYLRETAEENGLLERVRFGHRVVRAEWSTATARWLVRVRAGSGEGPVEKLVSARWIFCGGGYYRYDEGYTPAFPGRERFAGEVVHPQHWPEGLDWADKRIVVIGSGATAVTLGPALAESARHVTLLQRTPSYVMPIPRTDRTAQLLKRLLSADRAHTVIRSLYITRQRLVWRFCQRFPRAARRFIRRTNVRLLPPGYDVDTHFNPPYAPWDQRLCAVPDADLFEAIGAGRVSMVTDHIETFTESGILLTSGRHLDADVIVTATGLNLQVAGGIELTVDGRPVRYRDTVVYRGLMLSGVPNFALSIGYTNASWTLKVGLLCEYFIRLLDHMDAGGHDAVRAVADPGMPTRPLLDFAAGYVQRSLGELPKQGQAAPWLMSKDYFDDRKLIRSGPLVDEHLRFSSAAAGNRPSAPTAAPTAP
ncbi:NAD(P)/FAD-dependent oxidoreductase [Streptomyces sp. NPDC000983]|uniref:flavin-containing monooxygenase n=1 Tax=Streptomyces sp. NPDC000983 TaxID=3154373 RepID=UPI003318366C